MHIWCIKIDIVLILYTFPSFKNGLTTRRKGDMDTQDQKVHQEFLSMQELKKEKKDR
jgi:hypothetical protein